MFLCHKYDEMLICKNLNCNHIKCNKYVKTVKIKDFKEFSFYINEGIVYLLKPQLELGIVYV